MKHFAMHFQGVACAALVCVAFSTAAPAQTELPSALNETYQDWVVRCTSTATAGASAQRSCEMVQDVRKRDGGERVMAALIKYQRDETARLTLIAPLGLALADGVQIFFDSEEAPALTLPYATCQSVGCLALAELTPDLLARFEAGTLIRVRVVTFAGQPADLPISLRGFTAARNRLLELQG